MDAADGLVDGHGNGGNSWCSSPGSFGITFTFYAEQLGSLPTHAGVVWTDGSGLVQFEAFNSAGTSLGIIGPVDIADGDTHGGTAEDRFFGISDPEGIWRIKIGNTIAGIEVDHLQYGIQAPVPAPAAVLLAGLGTGLVGWIRKRRVA